MQFYPTLRYVFIPILCLCIGNILYTGLYINCNYFIYSRDILHFASSDCFYPSCISFKQQDAFFVTPCGYDMKIANKLQKKTNNPHWQVKYFFLQCLLTSYPVNNPVIVTRKNVKRVCILIMRELYNKNNYCCFWGQYHVLTTL